MIQQQMRHNRPGRRIIRPGGTRPALGMLAAALLCAAPVEESLRAAEPAASENTPLRLGPDFPSAESFYPAQALRDEQEGSVVILACVSAHGELTAAPTVAASSGNELLDTGALELARAGSGRYIPPAGTVCLFRAAAASRSASSCTWTRVGLLSPGG